jgi:hypothetical protein
VAAILFRAPDKENTRKVLTLCATAAYGLKYAHANPGIHGKCGNWIVSCGWNKGEAGEMEDHIWSGRINRTPYDINVLAARKVTHVPNNSV